MNYDNYAERGGRFIRGAAILSITGIIAKVLGAFFRIPLNNWIGAEGMSYYGVAYPIYSFFLIIATAGLPVGISKMVSDRVAREDYANAHRIYKVSLYLMAFLGIAGFIICFFGADFIAAAMGNEGGAASLRAIAPALLTAPLVSSFRGYSQGQQDMLPTGASEMAEQLLRVIAGLSLSYLFLQGGMGLEKAASGATFGASAGSIAALLLLLVIYASRGRARNERIRKSTAPRESNKNILKELLRIAVPITIGSAILPFMMMIDLMLVMNRLQATGWSYEESKVLYGLISGFCDPLIGFPQVFTIAVSVSLVPAVSAAFARKDYDDVHHNVQVGIKTGMIISFPCMVGLITLAKPILMLLYPSQLEDAVASTLTLQILSLGVVCLTILRTYSSVLQGIGRAGIPVINLTIGVIFKFIVTWILVGIPSININGAAIGNVVAYGTTAILNYIMVRKLTGTRVSTFHTYVKPLAASLIMGVGAYFSYQGFYSLLGSNSLATLAAIVIAVIVYVLAIFLTRCISEDEILLMPKGRTLLRLCRRLHLVKRKDDPYADYVPRH